MYQWGRKSYVTTNKFKFLGKDFDEKHPSTEIESEEALSLASNEQEQSKSNQQEVEKVKKTKKSSPLKKMRDSGDLSTQQSQKNNEDKPGKRNNPDYKTVGILLPKQLHKQAKVLLMDDEQKRDFSDLMTELLEQWLNKKMS